MPKLAVWIWWYVSMCCIVFVHVIAHILSTTSSPLFIQSDITGINQVIRESYLIPEQIYVF